MSGTETETESRQTVSREKERQSDRESVCDRERQMIYCLLPILTDPSLAVLHHSFSLTHTLTLPFSLSCSL